MRTIGNTPVDGEVRAVATGTLPSGVPVVVNSDGTVSVVGNTGTFPAAGSPSVYEADPSGICAATFDSNSNKVVIAYSNAYAGFSYSGVQAVVGTVSGNTISFGTPSTATTTGQRRSVALTFDSNSNKVVIAYANINGSAEVRVGTVSGTSISFVGNEVQIVLGSTNVAVALTFDSNSNKVVIVFGGAIIGGGSWEQNGVRVGTISGNNISFGTAVSFTPTNNYFSDASVTFDSNLNKVVITYRLNGTGSNITYGHAIVGTVSGTSMTFGTPVVFNSASTNATTATFDSSANKVVIACRDASIQNKGTAIVGTVSGTNISFGTALVFSTDTILYPSATFDSNSNKVVIGHMNSATSFVRAFIGTVSGTSISSSAEHGLLQVDAGGFVYLGATFDSNSKKVVLAYADTAANYDGTAAVVSLTGPSLNLSTQNYIGMSKHAAANGTVAVIQTSNSINDAQTGLTAGQDYFVQTDGSLSETPATPSVFAGTAVSATKIIVKG